jgi:hypothetical protein
MIQSMEVEFKAFNVETFNRVRGGQTPHHAFYKHITPTGFLRFRCRYQLDLDCDLSSPEQQSYGAAFKAGSCDVELPVFVNVSHR